MATTQQFSVYRIVSVTRPDLGVGMLQGFGSCTREQLEALTSGILGFYLDDDLMQARGDERLTEQFMLQGSNSLDGPWENIKPIVPLPGEDASEPDFGNCTRCGTALEESEFAIGDVCDGCRPQHMEDWEANQERLAEEAADRRRYPEESDDEYYSDTQDDYSPAF